MNNIGLYKIYVPLTIVAIYILFKIFREPRPLIKAFTSIFFSTSVLLILNALSDKIGICMPLNSTNIITAGVLGIPGVCLLTILNAVF